MFQRFHAMREQRDSGFTLIELLVVILIIAILAAIAIPVFLRQREKGWRSQMESALKNAATAQESWLTGNTSYTDQLSNLSSEGLKYAPDVSIGFPSSAVSGTHYCMFATHASLSTVTYWYSSNTGRPVTGTSC
jgi:type IV pilus assembly protein PilA